VNLLKVSPIVKRDIYILVLMLFTVPLAGEINFYPINGTFRISFGAPTFFFFLLFFHKTPVFLPGFLTGMLVVAFRILKDLVMLHPFHWITSFHTHYSNFFFYFSYSLFFYFAKINRFENRPLLIGCIGIIAEILSDLIELLTQSFVFHIDLSLEALKEIMIIAFSHTFIVLSFFNMMMLYETRSRERQIRKQNEHMLMLISNLYEESIHLKKTLQNAENITKKSYDFYRSINRLRGQPSTFPIEEFRSKALEIAGEVHEIKKDNQRIYAGISKLISDESFTDFMNVQQLMDLIVKTNKKYARLLEKDIQFVYTIEGVHPHYHVFTTLSIINNIVANAVEAIHHVGNIFIHVKRAGDFVEFQVCDNGPGIAPKHKEMIFKPGFTSKYDQAGNPSTGIGLSYIKEMIQHLEGSITMESGSIEKGAAFTIRLLVNHLSEGR
jgi:two-component system, sensor histidine kinase YcbA